MILGLDVGGANTKFASSDGSIAESIYLPLWRGASLAERLWEIAETVDPDAVAVVMTGELADCYSSKLEGIKSICSAVTASFGCPVSFWGVSGFSWRDPIELAAANWSASATLVASDIGDCLFVDMGSTTTDMIPVKERPLAALSDYERLFRGELIYSGILRTPIGALLREVEIDGRQVPTCPELFAVTADAYLVAGDIQAEDYTCDAPDGGGKDRDSALRRLVRVVCADLEEIGETGAVAIALQAKAHQKAVLSRAMATLAKRHCLERVAAAGIGEGVIEKASIEAGLGFFSLSERYGRSLSAVFPAYAVARLLESSL